MEVSVSVLLSFMFRHLLRNKDVRDLRNLLAFDSMAFREDTIKQPVDGSCKWILEHPVYRTWHEDFGVPCITGKSGSGKSVLMKFLSAQLSLSGRVISFYFNGAGYGLEKSRIGFIRCLLWQLVAIPQDTVPNELVSTLYDVDSDWSYYALTDLLKLCLDSVLAKTDLFVILDGLDECEEGHSSILATIRETLMKFRQEKAKMGIKSSARNRPGKALPIHPLRIDLGNGNLQDIEKYIELHVTPPHGHRITDTNYLASLISSSKNHSFLFSVVTIKFDQLRGGFNLLDTVVPEFLYPEIDTLYRGQIQSLSNSNIETSALLFEWIFCAAKPLSVTEIQEALLLVKPSTMSWKHKLEVLSGGLIELAGKRIQVIHSSVVDFFRLQQPQVEYTVSRNVVSSPDSVLNPC